MSAAAILPVKRLTVRSDASTGISERDRARRLRRRCSPTCSLRSSGRPSSSRSWSSPVSRRSRTLRSAADDAHSRPDRGQSPAALAGLARASELGCTRALMVPGDCPLLDPSEIDELLSDRRIEQVDCHAANALLLDPRLEFEPKFGPDSLRLHTEEALRCGCVSTTSSNYSRSSSMSTPATTQRADRRPGARARAGTAHAGRAPADRANEAAARSRVRHSENGRKPRFRSKPPRRPASPRSSPARTSASREAAARAFAQIFERRRARRRRQKACRSRGKSFAARRGRAHRPCRGTGRRAGQGPAPGAADSRREDPDVESARSVACS